MFFSIRNTSNKNIIHHLPYFVNWNSSVLAVHWGYKRYNNDGEDWI